MNFPIKITSDYSLLKSMIKINDLMDYCNNHDIKTCGICDENLFGVMCFYNNCKKNNIKPLIGLDIILDNNHIYLYAKNYDGYQNLLKINTIIQERNISLLDLELYASDIIALLPYESMDLYKDINSIYKDMYITYNSDSEKKNALIMDKRVIRINNIKSLSENDAKYLNYLFLIRTGKIYNEIEFNDYKNNVYEENITIEELKIKEEFANKIDINIPKNKNYIPKYDANVDSYSHLVQLTNKGLNRRLNGNINKTYQERLDYELNVIKKMGFVDYFLIVYDYVLFAKKNGILVGVGRGSAAGSLVSYTLGITDIDPIKYNLLFERFLNPERVTMPDIDIDFENTKRDIVVDYVKDKYNHDNVAGIMTFGTLKSRLVLRTISKCLNVEQRIVDNFISLIDSKLTLKENLNNIKVKEMLNNNEELKKVYKISLKLEDLKRNISSHAAGVVICSEKLDSIIPICINDNEKFTGVTMEYLEDLGILKMDFLAIKNLTTIAGILGSIEKDTSKKLNLNNIDLNDDGVLKLFQNGNTIGIFQFESNGMVNFLQKLKPSKFEDLTAAIALYRPGPMENIDLFIRRKYGKEKIDYIHPDLENILKETYGIIIYQEQIMQILVKIGGYSFAEADNIRRAMSKKKKEIIEKEKNIFIEKAINNNYSKELAIKIYDMISKFANYGFNKSHSVAYAFIGYQMAYLKKYFSNYFYASLLNNVIGSESKTKEYMQEAKKLGFKILSPDINNSEKLYYVKNNNIQMPFGVIKNIGENTVNNILIERQKNKYLDFIDFTKRIYKTGINSKIISTLINASVFASFNINKKTLIENLDIVINYASLAADLDEEFIEKPEIVIKEEYSLDELRYLELISYGFYISNHPSSKYNEKDIIKHEFISNCFNKIIKTVVLIENVKSIKTKSNEDMAFVSASDETGEATYVLFNSVMKKIDNIEIKALYEITGKVAKRFDKYQINVISIRKIKDN